MNQKFIRTVAIFSLALSFCAFTSIANAEISQANEQAPNGINTNEVGEQTQDEGTGINVNVVGEEPNGSSSGDQSPESSDNPSSNGGSHGGSGSNRRATPTPSPETFDDMGAGGDLDLEAGPCTYLRQYLKLGGNNNPMEVRKLQLFLKNNENLDVDVNNVFDEKTFRAVEAFQIRYTAEILGPWGATLPSGQVYISTTKKINELECKKPIAFTSQDLAIFAAFKAAKAHGMVMGADGEMVESSTPTPSSTATVDKDDNSGNSASAATGFSRIGNFFRKIWNFIFGK